MSTASIPSTWRALAAAAWLTTGLTLAAPAHASEHAPATIRPWSPVALQTALKEPRPGRRGTTT